MDTKSREPIIHELKIWPEHIDDLAAGRKTFEIRSTKDRDFRAGDSLYLNEYLPDTMVYTGRQLRAKVVGMHTGFGVVEGYAILSLAEIEKTGSQWIEVGAEPVRLPGAEGLAEKVREIQAGVCAQDTTGWAPPPEIADSVAIRFGRDAKFEEVPGGNLVAVWISRKTILEQLGIRELTPQHRVLGEGFVAVGVADLRCAIKRIHHLAPETPWPGWFNRLYSVSKGGRS